MGRVNAPESGFAELSAIAGQAATEKLRWAFAGVRLHIPRHPGGTKLERIVGPDVAAKLGRRFGGCTFEIPGIGQNKRLMIVALREQGMTGAQIARELRCTERHVYRVLARQRRSDAGAATSPQPQGTETKHGPQTR